MDVWGRVDPPLSLTLSRWLPDQTGVEGHIVYIYCSLSEDTASSAPITP